MARPKKSTTGDLLAHQPAPAAPAAPEAPPSIPAILEYRPLMSGDDWRVEKFEFFCAEFEMRPRYHETMATFHELAQPYDRAWLFVRRLFGVAPVMLPATANLDDYRTLTWEELGGAFGLDKENISAELDVLRVVWRNHLQGVQPETEDALPSDGPQAGLQLDDTLLAQFGFSEKMFEVTLQEATEGKPAQMRAKEDNKLERDWFCRRLMEWDKMLREPMTATTAREALLNDLFLRRIGDEMGGMSPTSARFKALRQDKKDIESAFQRQLDALQQQFPEIAVAGKVSFRGNLFDVIKAWREYRARGDRRLMDRIRTAAEIEFLGRQSVQKPEPLYRFGQNTAIIDAIINIWNPEYRCQLNHGTLRKFDVGVRRAIDEVRLQINEPLVDLEKGVMPGEGDNYPDLMAPPA